MGLRSKKTIILLILTIGLPNISVVSPNTVELTILPDFGYGGVAWKITDTGYTIGYAKDEFGTNNDVMWYDGSLLTIPISGSFSVTDINENGEIVGTYNKGQSAFFYDHTDFFDINAPEISRALGYRATKLNNQGDVLVQFNTKSTSYLGVWNKNSGMNIIHSTNVIDATLTGYSINELGVVVGGEKDSKKTETRVFVWSPGVGVTFMPQHSERTLTGTTAIEVTDSGLILGRYFGFRTTTSIPVVWNEEGLATLIPIPEGAVSAFPYDINENGMVVGTMMVGAYFVGWKWSESTGFETLSIAADAVYPYSINDGNTIVGYVQPSIANARGEPFAYLSTNDYLPLPDNGAIGLGSYAYWVNNQNEVVGEIWDETIGNFRAAYWSIPIGNTPSGTNVEVTPIDGMTLLFDEVTTGGSTDVIFSETNPGPSPQQFRFLGQYYDIVTDATFSGSVTICINYDDTGLSPGRESRLRFQHLVDGSWQDITSFLDTDSNIICGQTTSFSWFAVAESLTPADQLQELISVFTDLNSYKVLNSGQANSLISKVENAIYKLESDKTRPAINMLEAVINQVDAFERAGILDTETNNQITSYISSVIEQIQSE